VSAIIVDASAVGAAILPDEGGVMADIVLKLASEVDFVEPMHWPIELMSLILRASRRGRITELERNEARDGAARLMEFAILDDSVGATAAFNLAIIHNMSIYDAGYLALAIHKKLPLLTKDKNLLRIAPLEKVELIWHP
jgi:predicted nucleic acid-binding protein